MRLQKLGCALLVVLAPAFLTISAAQERKLVITGASTAAPLVAEIAKRFEERHKGVRVDVQTGGSSRGVSDARAGLADIGMVSRALSKDESDLKAFLIANDGMSMILHKSNPLSTLTREQIIDIYLGKITNWKDIGGKNEKITVVTKAEGRSTLELFLGYFKLSNRAIKAQVVIGDNQQGIKTVAGNPGAIGYVSIGAAEYESQNRVPIKLLPLGGVAATSENVRNGTFPFARSINIVTKSVPQGLQKQFIEFATSAAVADLVKEQYFVAPGR
jgi:phosphate transport system substrate-binding protein